MSSLLSGVLAGGWPFLVGWVFPSALSLTLFSLVAGSQGRSIRFVAEFHRLPATTQTLVLVAGSIALALVLSALATPLYRILEGYYLPGSLQSGLGKRQLAKRDALMKQLKDLRARKDQEPVGAVRRGLLAEKLRRYPVDDDEIAPTRFANAIHAFETYAWHRFQLDSQTLWSELMAVVPATIRTEQEKARAAVDFFVAFFYLSIGFAAGLLAIALQGGVRPWLLTALAFLALCLLPVWYALAVQSTDNWQSSVRALVNLGRKPLADALNLALPTSIEEERNMWQRVGWLVKSRYHPRVSALLRPFALAPTISASEESTLSPTPMEDGPGHGADPDQVRSP